MRLKMLNSEQRRHSPRPHELQNDIIIIIILMMMALLTVHLIGPIK